MRETGERYYRILDLEPGASPEEIHQGYIDLTWVWHPDRFIGNPRLQQKAQCKLQEINEAHAQLRSLLATPRTQKSRPKSESHVYPSPQAQSSKDNLSQQQGAQTWEYQQRGTQTREYQQQGTQTREYQQQGTQTREYQQQGTQTREYQQQGTQTRKVDDKKTAKDGESPVGSKKSRQLDEWLD